MDEKKIFKAYLRGLMRSLKALKTALKEKEYVKAEKILDDLIKDTQKGIED